MAYITKASRFQNSKEVYNYTTMIKKLPNLIALLFLSVLQVQAQDVHLSHIHASPMLLNPSMTGLFNGDVRLIGNTRSQWQSVTKGYTTAAGSVDMKLFSFRNGDVLGAGLQVYTDKAGDLNFKTNMLGGSVSYMKSLNGRRGGNYISFGIQASQMSNGIDFTRIEAFDYEPSIQNGADNRVRYLDITAGMTWYYSLNRNTHIYLGASVFHLNRPLVSFFKEQNVSDDLLLFRKLVLHGGGDIQISRKSSLRPSFIFKDQGPHQEITMGTFWKYKTNNDFKSDNPTSLYFGGWLRWHAENRAIGTDAVVAAVRFDYKKTYLTFTFDINISSLTRVSYGSGGPEFSIVQVLESKNRYRRPAKVKCPAFSH